MAFTSRTKLILLIALLIGGAFLKQIVPSMNNEEPVSIAESAGATEINEVLE